VRATPFILALAAAVVTAGGCAWSDQRIQLRPTIPFARSDLAHGRVVALRVADERSRTEIGRRIAPGVGGSIGTDPDLSPLVRDSAADALHRYGFTLAESGARDAAILDLELRNLDYEVAREMFSISVHAWAALEASCRAGDRAYEKFYRDHVVVDRKAFRLRPEANDALLNDVLSGVLRKVFADRELLDCLAGPERVADPSGHTP
jgi:uncharacterized lipoprotein YajG